MKERVKATEFRNMYERSGLTLAHWELILKTSSKDSKERAFTQAVINGQIDSGNFSHREYLGRSHWKRIKNNMRRITRGLRGTMGKWVEPQRKQLAQDIVDFATSEWIYHPTLDDFIKPKSIIGIYWSMEEIKWDEVDQTWHFIAKQIDRGVVMDKYIPTLLHSYYFEQGEVVDPAYTSPDKLLDILKTTVPVDILRKRVKERRGYLPDYARNWEQPIIKV